MESSALSASGCETSGLSVLVGGVGDPVDSWVVSDGVMGWVNHNNLEPLVNGILTYPVRVQDSESTALAAGSLLSNRSKVADKLLLSDTRILWLTIVDTLGNSLLSVTSLHSNSVHNVTLLGLVTESVSLIGSGWLTGSMDSWELSVFPSSKSEHESHNIGLLLVPKLLKVLVCSHKSRN